MTAGSVVTTADTEVTQNQIKFLNYYFTILKMVYREICEELRKKAKEELNEKPDEVKTDIEHIKNWINKQSYLNARTDDQWLLVFLRHAKFSLERTKEKIDLFYTMRTMIPDFFKNRDPRSPIIQCTLKTGVFLPLLKSTDPTAPRTIVCRPGTYDPKIIALSDVAKMCLMIMDIILLEDDSCLINGFNFIYNVNGLTLAHIPNLLHFKQIVISFTKSYPNRIKGLHYINMSPTFDFFFALIKSLIPEKIRNRTYVHHDLESLQKKLSKENLPEEYGGNVLLPEVIDEFSEKLEKHRDWFLEDEQYGTDEKLRPGKPITSENFFGIQGSFRQLTVD